ncbi:MAG TPA: hypothetical protein PLF32_00090 [Bacteroidales bacterium]|nr:hypothetical protein [Bacteroidales bacterium]HOR81039.1 hypothetical protein [Bacteroidales bacterium]HPJ91094.1 hypothetical protein [Bacteroidales bacterium]
MKTNTSILTVIISILISTLTLSCDKNAPAIHHLKSSLGGCNNGIEKSMESDEEKNDTVIINISNDAINISVGLNYTCCAPFVTNCNIKNNTITILISDTCSNPPECYCRCDCYYTFDYYFDNISSDKYYWQIILRNPRAKDDIIFDQGIIRIEK